MASTEAIESNQTAATDAATSVLTPQNFPSHITVKFFTRNERYQVPETPFKVPSDLTRFGLSEIVNHLLNLEPPIPFEFLVEYREDKKAFLRTSLKSFFIKMQKYPETVLELEYTEAQPAPKCVDTVPHDDWVSAIDHCYAPWSQQQQYVLTGCYDGVVRIIDPNTGAILSSAKHKNPVKALAVAEKSSDASGNAPESLLFCTATRDEALRIWRYDARRQHCQLQIVLHGHDDIVECLSLNRNHSMVATGSADKTLKLWELRAFEQTEEVDVSAADADDGDDELSAGPKKKQKVVKQSLVGTLEGHFMGVTCVDWSGDTLVSGSSDHTLRLWDVSKAQCTTTLNGSKVPSAISRNEALGGSGGVLLTTHPDGMVRMWDARAQQPRASLFKSHKGWVRSVQWSPSNQYQFVSGADDNLIKLWDIRSAVPLHSVSHHVEEDAAASGDKMTDDEPKQTLTRMAKKQKVENHKVLAVRWAKLSGASNSTSTLFSGSTDCTLKKHTFNAAEQQ